MAHASLDGPFAKLGRAHHHLECLYDAFNRTGGPETHGLVPEQGEEPRSHVWKVHNVPDVPPDWALIVGDFAHNLRSALDHLVWQLVLLSGSKPGRSNQFPICSTGTDYWCSRKPEAPSTRDRTLAGVANQYRTLIDAVQPYRRGDDVELSFLAGLNDLSNFDKHRVIQAAFSATLEPTPDDFDVISRDGEGFVYVAMKPGTRLENGAEVMRTEIITNDPKAEVKMKANLPIAIGFGETRIRLDGLGPMYEFVRDYIKSFSGFFG